MSWLAVFSLWERRLHECAARYNVPPPVSPHSPAPRFETLSWRSTLAALLRSSLRQATRHPWQTLLTILGIALGVAAVVAIDLSTESVNRSLLRTAQTLAGTATHRISAGPQGIDEQLYVQLRRDRGMNTLAPVVTGYVQRQTTDPQRWRLLGVDPLAEAGFRDFTVIARDEVGAARWFTQPAAVYVYASAAEQLGVEAGDTLEVIAAGQRVALRVADVIQAEAQRAPGPPLLLADVATAQEILGLQGRLSYIDVHADDGIGAESLLSRLRAALPPGVMLLELGDEQASLTQLTRAFRINLTAMGLLALVVGGFIIFNTMMFAVLRRRRELGTFRALGVTRREISVLTVIEAAVLGALGAVLGIVLGGALAEAVSVLVAQTVNDLYAPLDDYRVQWYEGAVLKAVVVGLLAAVAAALAPAWEASRVTPAAALRRSSLERRVHRAFPWVAAGGVVVMVAAFGLLQVTGASLILSFVALFLLLMGYACVCPALTWALTHLTPTTMRHAVGYIVTLATRGLRASLSRTGVAVAALAVAVAATIGVGTMISSFRQAVDQWLQYSLRADFYVSVADFDTQPAGLDPALIAAVRTLPGIQALSQGRRTALPQQGARAELLVLDVPWEGFSGYQLKSGDLRQAWGEFRHAEAVLVSEPYANRHRLEVGDRIRLDTHAGPRDFHVAGVFYDYSSEHGLVVMGRDTYIRHFNDYAVTALGVYAAAQADRERIEEALRRTVGGRPGVLVRANRALREISLAIFDRTFAVTGVLRIVTLVIALVGIVSAVMALQLERAREWAVLRALGLTPLQLSALLLIQAAIMGLYAGLLALPLGYLIAAVLIFDVNLRAFGWTLPLYIDGMQLMHALLLAIAAGLVAGLYPAWRQARMTPVEALRDE